MVLEVKQTLIQHNVNIVCLELSLVDWDNVKDVLLDLLHQILVLKNVYLVVVEQNLILQELLVGSVVLVTFLLVEVFVNLVLQVLFQQVEEPVHVWNVVQEWKLIAPELNVNFVPLVLILLVMENVKDVQLVLFLLSQELIAVKNVLVVIHLMLILQIVHPVLQVHSQLQVDYAKIVQEMKFHPVVLVLA